MAYSSFINDEVIKDAQKVGFEIILEAPLKYEVIKDEIFSRLEANNNF